MSYYVYESIPLNRTIIHRGDCRHCNDGKGINGTLPNAHHIWYGPMSTRAAALQCAQGTGRIEVRECRHCKKKTGD